MGRPRGFAEAPLLQPVVASSPESPSIPLLVIGVINLTLLSKQTSISALEGMSSRPLLFFATFFSGS
jgi:hypothetical protein